MRQVRWLPLIFALGTSLLFGASRAASPRATSSFASAVTESRQVQGVSEGAAFIATLSAELQAQLAAERRLLLPEDRGSETSMGGYIKAVALFNQPKTKVYELITHPNTQVLFLPRLKRSDTVERTAEGELTEFHLGVGLITVKFRTQHWWWNDQSRMEWALDPSYSNDVKVAEGFWQIFAIDDKTSVGEYGTLVDTGLPVPESLQGYLTRKDVPAALQAIQSYVDSGGTWRRPD